MKERSIPALLVALWSGAMVTAHRLPTTSSLLASSDRHHTDRLNLWQERRELETINYDLDLCLDALTYSDVDFNRQVDETEYITMLELFWPEGDKLWRGIDNPTTFEELPIIFRSNFLVLACLCIDDPDADPTCCPANIDQAHISNLGAAPSEVPTTLQAIYLDRVCFLTQDSLEDYTAGLSPTTSPSASPTVAPTETPTGTQTDTPTALPTQAPTATPTKSPSPEPTRAPSHTPTVSPTKAPTALPTKAPTASPTKAPTATPTKSPSPEPTRAPSDAPTSSPTLGPTPVPTTTTPPPTGTLPPTVSPTTSAPTESPTTQPPTGQPTRAPTTAPTQPTTQPPTGSPSFTPTAPPSTTVAPTTAEPVPDVVIQTNYVIGIRGGTAAVSDYQDDLEAAMDLLATNIATTLPLVGSRLLLRQRRLAVTVDVPSTVAGTIQAVCPDFVPVADRCEDVSASFGVFLTEQENATAVKQQFETTLMNEILEQELQVALDQVNDESVVYIVTGLEDNADDDGNRGIGGDSTDLGGGAISGIVLGSMFLLILVFLLFTRREKEDEEYYLKQNESVDAEEIQAAPKSAPAAPILKKKAPAKSPTGSDITPMVMPPAFNKQDSDAGSSGWSSREGLSSLDSSADEDTRASSGGAKAAPLDGTDPPGIAASSTSDSAPSLQMTYSELDEAIQKADWAAVGVTAALLASQSYDSSQTPDTNRQLNVETSLNPSRAAELDRLVEEGNWQAVIRTAARYDQLETTVEHGSQRSQSSAGDSASVGSAGTGPSAYSGSGAGLTAGSGVYTTGTTASDSNTRVKKLGEIRAEVEQLVEKVVPEEKDNIDEMMIQFRGREEELVETLRSMQEREVAQKARVEGQKRAKRDARAAVDSKQAEEKEEAAVAVDNTGAPADEQWMREIDGTVADESADGTEVTKPTSNTSTALKFGRLGIMELEPPQEEDEDRENKKIDQLTKAIDSGDWDKTVVLAGHKPVEFNNDNASTSGSSQSSDHGVEMNELVDKGDWEGVVALAKGDVQDTSTDGSDSSQEKRRSRRDQRQKEEEEALEQAGIWNAIAEQTKSDAAESASNANRAAKVAADWAIARSLSELNKADDLNAKKGRDPDKSGDSLPPDNEEGTI